MILAAGASSRMGRPKALLEYRGETFAERLVRVLSTVCDPVIVVLGYHADVIRARMAGNFVINPDPDRGQLSSLQTALAVVPREVGGFLFTPVDCPTIGEQTVRDLFRVFLDLHAESIIIPRYGSTRGHPVIVPGSLISEFAELAPTEKTRTVIDRHPDRIHYVDVDDPGILADIDDPESYKALAR